MQTLNTLLFILTFVAALGCAVVAGSFFAFSNFVMKALARIAPASGVAAMQAINVTVLNAGFLSLFLGTAATCLGLAIAAAWRWPAAGTACLLVGAMVYLVGTFLVTLAFNVPRNEALAGIDGEDQGSVTHWRGYVADWTRWNHVRSTAALAAAACLVFALTRLQVGA